MIHVLGCGRVVGSRQGVQGSPENEDLVTRQFLENIFEMHFFREISSSPGMMVPVHAGRGHLHATGPPVVLEHKFTLIQNNILAICI